MKILVALLLLMALPTVVLAQWVVSSQGEPHSLGNGVVYVDKEVTRPAAEVRLRLVICDLLQVSVGVVAQSSKRAALPLNDLGKSMKTLAMCNGGYFDPGTFLPVGLQISRGVSTGKFVPGMPFGGGLVVKNGTPSLYVDSEYSGPDGVSDLIQCCPMLVVDGVPLSEKAGGPKARRTFLAIDRGGYLIMGTTSGVGLQELAVLRTTSGIISQFPVERALNLDGGPSTGLWCRDIAGTEYYSKEGWRVPNVLTVSPKPTPP